MNLGPCEYVVFRISSTSDDPRPFSERFDDKTKVVCTHPATTVFDRGTDSPYPEFHGPYNVCDKHVAASETQRMVNGLVRRGEI